jgi:hypothetical protein
MSRWFCPPPVTNSPKKQPVMPVHIRHTSRHSMKSALSPGSRKQQRHHAQDAQVSAGVWRSQTPCSREILQQGDSAGESFDMLGLGVMCGRVELERSRGLQPCFEAVSLSTSRSFLSWLPRPIPGRLEWLRNSGRSPSWRLAAGSSCVQAVRECEPVGLGELTIRASADHW